MRFSFLKLTLLAVGLFLGANGCCDHLFTPHRVSSQEEAGSTHIAVLACDEWEDYRDALQPKFTFDEQKAISEAIPKTLAIEEQFIDVLNAALRVNLPLTSTTVTDTTTSETGKKTTSTKTKTDETKPGELPTISSGDLPASKGSTPKPGDLLKDGPGTDPFLKYLAATAIYQEVQLLNKYVKSAAERKGYKPYIVRLQVTCLPQARNEPYDAYVNLSFFSGPFSESNPPPPHPSDKPSPPMTNAGSTQPAKDTIPPVPTPVPVGTPAANTPSPEKSPLVVPLLVTDNLESAMHSRSVDVIRQYALALTALIHGVGVGADMQSFSEQL